MQILTATVASKLRALSGQLVQRTEIPRDQGFEQILPGFMAAVIDSIWTVSALVFKQMYANTAQI